MSGYSLRRDMEVHLECLDLGELVWSESLLIDGGEKNIRQEKLFYFPAGCKIREY
jgi:hypothetical protein